MAVVIGHAGIHLPEDFREALVHFFGALRILGGEVVGLLDVDALALCIVELVEIELGNRWVEEIIEIADQLVAANADRALHRAVGEVPDHGVPGLAAGILDQFRLGGVGPEQGGEIRAVDHLALPGLGAYP